MVCRLVVGLVLVCVLPSGVARAGRERPAEGVPRLQQLLRRLHPRRSRHGGVRPRSRRSRRAHHRLACGHGERRHRTGRRADRPRPFQGHGLQLARDLAERRHRRHAAAAAGDGHHHRPAELPCERRRQGRIDRRGRADRAAGPGGACDRSVELLGDERAGIDRDGRRGKHP